MKLLAVRHGQASFHAADYDQLSAQGALQARALGDWLARHEHRFDRVVSGRLRRHAQTVAGIAEGFSEAGAHLPVPQADAAFDEFDHRRVLAGFLQRFPQHPAAAAAALGPAAEPQRLFQLLRAALQHWARGELDDLAEPWPSFKQRTREGLQRLATEARGESVLLVSSGGVIAQFAAEVLEAPDHRAVELNLSLRNSALCELVCHPDEVRLASWNALPHLADQRSLWTHV